MGALAVGDEKHHLGFRRMAAAYSEAAARVADRTGRQTAVKIRVIGGSDIEIFIGQARLPDTYANIDGGAGFQMPMLPQTVIENAGDERPFLRRPALPVPRSKRA